MRPRQHSLRRHVPALTALLAGTIALALAGIAPGTHSSASAGTGAPPEPAPHTDDSVPAREVTMIGSTPEEAGAAGDVAWGVGQGPSGTTLVRYLPRAEGLGEWTLGPELLNAEGQPLSGFELDTPEAVGSTSAASPLAGQMTPDGAGVLVGYVQKTKQALLVREPGAATNHFTETEPSAESQLQPGERLISFTRAPLIAPLDEPEGHAGALVVPVKEANSGVEESVLHWEGAAKRWVREPIELPAAASSTGFRVLGIGASSSSNAWLVAQL